MGAWCTQVSSEPRPDDRSCCLEQCLGGQAHPRVRVAGVEPPADGRVLWGEQACPQQPRLQEPSTQARPEGAAVAVVGWLHS